MTSTKYTDIIQRHILDQGYTCPVCNSPRIVCGTPQMDPVPGLVSCRMSCIACASTWDDLYTLSATAITAVGPEVPDQFRPVEIDGKFYRIEELSHGIPPSSR